MPNLLCPSCLSSIPTFRKGRFSYLAFLLLVLCSINAVAQGRLKEATDGHEAGAASNQLTGTDQFLTTGQPPAAAAQNQDAQNQDAQNQDAQNQERSQSLIRVIPYGRRSGSDKKVGSVLTSLAPVAPQLTYWGGPVISNLQVIVVFWGPNVASAVTADGTIDQFYTDITSSRYFDALTEYTTAGTTGADGTSTSNQTIGHGTFAGKFTISPSICPGTAACTVTDAQIQTELTRQINNQVLPVPQTDAQGNINTYYAVYFPPNVTIAVSTLRSCVQGGFCAYHSDTASLIPYGVFPDFSTGGCSLQGACGSGTTLQIATIASSHEMAETVTDPQGAVASTFGPPLGWFDNSNQGEIADLCDPFDTTVNAGSSTYSVELLFSNLQNRCISAPPVFSMPSPAGGAGPSVPFGMTLTIRDSISNIITPLSYLGTVHFTSSDPGAILPADYNFTAADAGVHTFPFTLTVLGDQTITVADTRSSGFTGTTTVNVNTVPDMTLTLQHSGNFGKGQTGSYMIAASNLGGGPTSGTVTVIDTLPFGMSAAAMSGTGWTCDVNTVSCTRADALPAGSTYPSITLTVNVSTVISSSVTNIATVSGGGETVTSDDLVGDVTTVVNAGVNLGVSTTPFQLFTNQGASGVTLGVTVVNVGSVDSSGAVTVTTTLGAGMTAAAINGTGWTCTLAGLTCSRSDALGSALSYPPVTVTFDVALDAPLGFSSISAAVSGGGDIDTANNAAMVTVDTGTAFGIFSNTGSVTVPAGTPAKFQVGVFGTAVAGTITFSCSGLPTASSCSFNPSSLANDSVFVTMTIATTARRAAATGPVPVNRNPWWLPELLLFAAVAGWSLKLCAAPRRRRRFVPVLGGCALLLAGILAGCGGTGSPSTSVTNTVNGTSAGTYTITFTATSPIGTDSRTMNLIVQ